MSKTRLDPNCWDGYKKAGTKMKGGVKVNNCVKVNQLKKAKCANHVLSQCLKISEMG